MKYYFPIKINSRRAHVCELRCDDDQKCVFEFLIDSESKNLLEIKSTDQLFFSSEGSDWNCKYSQLKYEVSKRTDDTGFDDDGGFDIYFYKDDPKKQKDAPRRTGNEKKSCFVVSKGDDESICFNIDRDQLGKNKTYTICIHLTNEEKDYRYKFKIHYCESKKQIKTAALDFGSEATQVRMSGDCYLPILDKMKGFYGITDSSTKFWQEDENRNLYKSIFFLNTNNCVLANGQKPHEYGDDEFVQALVQRVQNDKLKIIPNLKLADMIDGGWANDIRISSKENHVCGYAIQNNGSPNDESYRKLILRNVLNYFMHCILKGFDFAGCRIDDCSVKRNCQDTSKCTQPIYLKLIILMPNVYSQEKVYDIISGLYEDFNTMKASYSAFNGIEVVCISESDAAFLGVANDSKWIEKFKKEKDSYSLIIDAGKGTTDFSILQQQKDGTKYKSLYKNGLPISGNYLTYAFYEAALEYFKSAKKNLSQILQDACKNNPSDVIEFMNILERFKKNYKQEGLREVQPLVLGETDLVETLDDCNNQLKKINSEEEMLPGLKDFINKRMDVIVKRTIENIKKVMPDKKQFSNVIFTGRGFLFKPFAQMMKDELVKEKLMPHNQEILQYLDAKSKHICVMGSFNLAMTASINGNSELICIPVMPKRKRFLSRITNFLADETEFIFEGMEVSSNADRVGIGNTDYRIDNPDLNPVLIFTGRDFLLQYEKEGKTPQAFNRGGNDTDKLEEAPEETRISLFPFFDGSIKIENIQGSQASSEQQTDQQTNSESNQETEHETNFE